MQSVYKYTKHSGNISVTLYSKAPESILLPLRGTAENLQQYTSSEVEIQMVSSIISKMLSSLVI